MESCVSEEGPIEPCPEDDSALGFLGSRLSSRLAATDSSNGVCEAPTGRTANLVEVRPTRINARFSFHDHITTVINGK